MELTKLFIVANKFFKDVDIIKIDKYMKKLIINTFKKLKILFVINIRYIIFI